MNIARTDWRVYWPDTTRVTCREPNCTAQDDDAVIDPGFRRILVADFLFAINKHAEAFHDGAAAADSAAAIAALNDAPQTERP